MERQEFDFKKQFLIYKNIQKDQMKSSKLRFLICLIISLIVNLGYQLEGFNLFFMIIGTLTFAFLFWIISIILFTNSDKNKEAKMALQNLENAFYNDICIPCLENNNYHNIKFQSYSPIPSKNLGLLTTDESSYVNCAIVCDEFEYAEVRYYHEIERIDSEGRTQTETVTTFDGVEFFIPYNIGITSSIRIIPSITKYGKEKTYSSMGESKRKNENLIDIEDIEFNEQFEVYVEDEHSAYYFLTSTVIEKIKKIRQNHDKVSIVVDANGIYVAIDDRKNYYRLFKLRLNLRKNESVDDITPDSYENDVKKLKELFNEFYTLVNKYKEEQ